MSNYLKNKFNQLFRFVAGICLYIFDSLLIVLLPFSEINKKSVLVIRLDRIGDFLLWSSQGIALRKKFPKDEYKLTLLANEIWVPLLSEINIFDEVIPIQVDRFNYPWIYRFRVAREIRQKGFGTVLNPIYSREFFRSDAIVRLSGAPITLGFKGDIFNAQPILRWIANTFYSSLFEVDHNLTELEINTAFLFHLGIDAKPLLANLKRENVSLPANLIKDRYFIISPGASSENRRWPIKNYAEVVKKIQLQYPMPGIICGDASDSSIAMELNQLLETKLVDLTGKTDIKGLIKLVDDACLLVANESGVAHIGAAVQTPTAVILGGGHYGRFFPYKGLEQNPPVETAFFRMNCYGCNWHCHFTSGNQELVPCVSKITTNQVVEKVALLLNKNVQ